jgi:hypothetical protein
MRPPVVCQCCAESKRIKEVETASLDERRQGEARMEAIFPTRIWWVGNSDIWQDARLVRGLGVECSGLPVNYP